MEIRHLCFAYDRTPILTDLNFQIQEGKVTTILGPNGCGKTTLFRLLTREMYPAKGNVYIKNRNIYGLERKDFARGVAIVQQNNTSPEDISVEQLVAFGRTPHQKFYGSKTARDEEKIRWAMEITNIYKYKDRAMGTLSGGQKQRVWFAMALAQDPKYLFLDEPTTFLDIRYQVQILELVKRLNREYGMTVIMVLHDINQAIAYSDRILCMKKGQILFDGTPYEVVTKENMRELYDIEMEVLTLGNRKHVLTECMAQYDAQDSCDEGTDRKELSREEGGTGV